MDLNTGINRLLPGHAGVRGADLSPRDSPKDIADAAQKFESLFLAQLLRAATRETSEESSKETAILDMAIDRLAETVTSHGGLGLAQTIANQLSTNGTAQPSPVAGVWTLNR